MSSETMMEVLTAFPHAVSISPRLVQSIASVADPGQGVSKQALDGTFNVERAQKLWQFVSGERQKVKMRGDPRHRALIVGPNRPALDDQDPTTMMHFGPLFSWVKTALHQQVRNENVDQVLCLMAGQAGVGKTSFLAYVCAGFGLKLRFLDIESFRQQAQDAKTKQTVSTAPVDAETTKKVEEDGNIWMQLGWSARIISGTAKLLAQCLLYSLDARDPSHIDEMLCVHGAELFPPTLWIAMERQISRRRPNQRALPLVLEMTEYRAPKLSAGQKQEDDLWAAWSKSGAFDSGSICAFRIRRFSNPLHDAIQGLMVKSHIPSALPEHKRYDLANQLKKSVVSRRYTRDLCAFSVQLRFDSIPSGIAQNAEFKSRAVAACSKLEQLTAQWNWRPQSLLSGSAYDIGERMTFPCVRVVVAAGTNIRKHETAVPSLTQIDKLRKKCNNVYLQSGRNAQLKRLLHDALDSFVELNTFISSAKICRSIDVGDRARLAQKEADLLTRFSDNRPSPYLLQDAILSCYSNTHNMGQGRIVEPKLRGVYADLVGQCFSLNGLRKRCEWLCMGMLIGTNGRAPYPTYPPTRTHTHLESQMCSFCHREPSASDMELCETAAWLHRLPRDAYWAMYAQTFDPRLYLRRRFARHGNVREEKVGDDESAGKMVVEQDGARKMPWDAVWRGYAYHYQSGAEDKNVRRKTTRLPDAIDMMCAEAQWRAGITDDSRVDDVTPRANDCTSDNDWKVIGLWAVPSSKECRNIVHWLAGMDLRGGNSWRAERPEALRLLLCKSLHVRERLLRRANGAVLAVSKAVGDSDGDDDDPDEDVDITLGHTGVPAIEMPVPTLTPAPPVVPVPHLDTRGGQSMARAQWNDRLDRFHNHQPRSMKSMDWLEEWTDCNSFVDVATPYLGKDGANDEVSVDGEAGYGTMFALLCTAAWNSEEEPQYRDPWVKKLFRWKEVKNNSL